MDGAQGLPPAPPWGSDPPTRGREADLEAWPCAQWRWGSARQPPPRLEGVSCSLQRVHCPRGLTRRSECVAASRLLLFCKRSVKVAAGFSPYRQGLEVSGVPGPPRARRFPSIVASGAQEGSPRAPPCVRQAERCPLCQAGQGPSVCFTSLLIHHTRVTADRSHGDWAASAPRGPAMRT